MSAIRDWIIICLAMLCLFPPLALADQLTADQLVELGFPLTEQTEAEVAAAPLDEVDAVVARLVGDAAGRVGEAAGIRALASAIAVRPDAAVAFVEAAINARVDSAAAFTRAAVIAAPDQAAEITVAAVGVAADLRDEIVAAAAAGVTEATNDASGEPVARIAAAVARINPADSLAIARAAAEGFGQAAATRGILYDTRLVTDAIARALEPINPDGDWEAREDVRLILDDFLQREEGFDAEPLEAPSDSIDPDASPS